MADNANRPSDKQILSRLRRSKKGLTAAALGTTVAHVRSLQGVVEVDKVKTGKAGRPAIIVGFDQARFDEQQAELDARAAAEAQSEEDAAAQEDAEGGVEAGQLSPEDPEDRGVQAGE